MMSADLQFWLSVFIVGSYGSEQNERISLAYCRRSVVSICLPRLS